MLSQRYEKCKGKLINVIKAALFLTNYEIALRPLRREDGEHYRLWMNAVFAEGEAEEKKKRKKIENQQAKRKSRMLEDGQRLRNSHSDDDL